MGDGLARSQAGPNHAEQRRGRADHLRPLAGPRPGGRADAGPTPTTSSPSSTCPIPCIRMTSRSPSGGMVDCPTEYTLEDIRKLPGRTVRAVTECAGNDGEFFDYIKEGSNMRKPSLRYVQAEEGGWRQTMGFGRDPGHRGHPAGDPRHRPRQRRRVDRGAVQDRAGPRRHPGGRSLRGAARLGRREARPGHPVSVRRTHRLRGGRSRHHQLRQSAAAGKGPARGHYPRLGP